LPNTTDTPTIVFRCDANLQTGLGHISRSLGLAEAFIEASCDCRFLGKFDKKMHQRLDAPEMKWELLNATSWSTDDAAALIDLATQTAAVGIVVDSYLLGVEYLEQLQRAGMAVLLIDDFAELASYPCTAVLNFTSRAESLSYPRDTVRTFLGPAWFPGRRKLRQLRAKSSRPRQHVRQVLVAAGGNDVHDFVPSVLETLLACDRNLSVHVVVTAAYAARTSLLHQLAMFNNESLVLSQLPDLAGEFEGADLCISGAGLTKYEAAYVGIPAGILSQNAGQARDAARFADLGLAVDLGPAAHIDPVRLTSQIQKLLQDPNHRESLHRQGLARFPVDPTRDLSVALLTEVFRSG
jgi:spore coat polysaccharide biosynthesis predicted glycosyltransferase SpsG